MNSSSSEFNETLVHLYAVASRLEGEGQYNNAKLARAAADGLCRQAAYHLHLPATVQGLAAEIQRLCDALDSLDFSQPLVAAMRAGAGAMSAGRLPMIDETPDPYVCRFCGHLVVGEPGYQCPDCGAPSATMQRFPPVYWLDALLPSVALERLRQTSMDISNLLGSLPEELMDQSPQAGGWSLHQALSHLLDAEGVLNVRIQRLPEADEPALESLAVFDWAGDEGRHPSSVPKILAAYRASRRQTLERVERIPLEDWQRAGCHAEFGRVTVCQQASYFAMHEITHLPQIIRLRSNVQ